MNRETRRRDRDRLALTFKTSPGSIVADTEPRCSATTSTPQTARAPITRNYPAVVQPAQIRFCRRFETAWALPRSSLRNFDLAFRSRLRAPRRKNFLRRGGLLSSFDNAKFKELPVNDDDYDETPRDGDNFRASVSWVPEQPTT